MYRGQGCGAEGIVEPPRWRGVNLGGWLVLERWMSPSLFDDVVPGSGDEATLLRRGGEAAQEAVIQFRDTFITEADFRWLKEEGEVNAVRLPLGFWCLEEHAHGTAYLPTSHYVDAVFDWAETYGIGVLLDLHGASGSQNAQHHSGTSSRQPRWLEAEHREFNLEVLQAWVCRWGQRRGFLGLGLGNEVAESKADALEEALAQGSRWWLEKLLLGGCYSNPAASKAYWEQVAEFYADAAALCRPHMHDGAVLVIDTCWDAARWGDKLRKIPGPVILDYHHYECFGEAKHADEHCQAEALERTLLRAQQDSHRLLLGEFSLALRPESRGRCDSVWQRTFWARQTELAEEHGAGWFFWSYKMAREGWSEWSFRESVELGWIPRVGTRKQSSASSSSSSSSFGVQAPPALVPQPLPVLLGLATTAQQQRRGGGPAAYAAVPGVAPQKADMSVPAAQCMHYNPALLRYSGSPPLMGGLAAPAVLVRR